MAGSERWLSALALSDTPCPAEPHWPVGRDWEHSSRKLAVSLGHIGFSVETLGRNNMTSSRRRGATRDHLCSRPRVLLISKVGRNTASHSRRLLRALGPMGTSGERAPGRGAEGDSGLDRPENWQREGCWIQVRGRLAGVTRGRDRKEAGQSLEGRTCRIRGWSSIKGEEKLVRQTVKRTCVVLVCLSGAAPAPQPSKDLLLASGSPSCPTCSPNVFHS